MSQKAICPWYSQQAPHEFFTMSEGMHDLDYDARRICVATDQLHTAPSALTHSYER